MDDDASRHRAGMLLSLSFFLFIAGNLPFLDPIAVQPAHQAQRALLYALSGLTLIYAFGLRAVLTAVRHLPLPAPLVIIMLWVMASVLWSASPLRTAIRAAESTVVMLYGATFVVLALGRLGTYSAVAGVLMRAMVCLAIYAMICNTIVHGEPLHLYVNKWVPDRPRLQLLHAHPLLGGDILALGIICILFTARLRLKEALAIASLAYLLLLADSTGARLTLPAIAVLSWLTGRGARTGELKIAALMLAAVIGAYVIAEHGATLFESRSSQRLLTMTGCAKLWETILASDLVGSFIGAGFDASSPLILELFNKEYHSHNEYISSIVELGYIGFTLHLLMLATWAFVLVRAGKGFAWAIFICIVVIGIINPVILTKPVPIFFFMVSRIGSLHVLRTQSATGAHGVAWSPRAAKAI